MVQGHQVVNPPSRRSSPPPASPLLPSQVAVLGEKLAEKHTEAVVLYNQIFQVW